MVLSFSESTKVLAKMKSFQMKMLLTITTVTIVLTDRGRVIWPKIRYGPAPSMDAASYVSRGINPKKDENR
jgi:hypothetical protein